MKNLTDSQIKDLTFEQKLDYEKLKVERLKARSEIIKWFLIAAGAVISFYVIDVGKLKIEKFTAESGNQERLLNSYLSATESPDPDLWKRKLGLIKQFSKDTAILHWADREEKYINEVSALLALYKETIKVASILANKQISGTTEWSNASSRFYQLYWAELPYYGESQPVISKMIAFKRELDEIQHNNDRQNDWESMDGALYELSKTLKEESKKLEQK